MSREVEVRDPHLAASFWLGHLLGVRGIATAAPFFPVFFLLLSLIIGLVAGATILAGQAWGARDAAQVGAVCTPLLVAGTPLGAAGVAVSALVAQLGCACRVDPALASGRPSARPWGRVEGLRAEWGNSQTHAAHRPAGSLAEAGDGAC
jgi:MatE